MSENERGRNIRFPQEIWDAVDADARRCKRSAVKHLEALLTVYYDLGNVEMDNSRLNSIQNKLPEKQGADYLEVGDAEKKKKKAV